MGTWGEGIFDNDGALDVVSELLEEAGLEDPGGSGTRTTALRALLGEYLSGLDDVLAKADPKPLARVCADALDELGGEDVDDLYEAQETLGALGLLLLLTDPPVPAKKLAKWRMAFDHVDRETTGEREFWDVYAAKVRKAFDRLDPDLRDASE